MKVVIEEATGIAVEWGDSTFDLKPGQKIIETEQKLDCTCCYRWDSTAKKFVQIEKDVPKVPRELALLDLVTKKVKKITVEDGRFVIVDYPT